MCVCVGDGRGRREKKAGGVGGEGRDGRGGIEVKPSHLHTILLKNFSPKNCHRILLIMILQKCVWSCNLFSFSPNNTIKIAHVQSH